jgi:hypothetical protein
MDNIMIIKKGAMFGLDARIALAIFGALSVISGAALYSAITTAKGTAVLAEMNEVGKAWEQHFLDTGRDLPARDASHLDYRKTAPLVEDIGFTGWNGPYLNYEPDGSSIMAVSSNYGSIGIYSLKDDGLLGSGTSWVNAKCTDDKDCFLWINFSGISDSITQSIDNLVDGNDGKSAGSFRWVVVGDSYDNRVYLKYTSNPRPTL